MKSKFVFIFCVLLFSKNVMADESSSPFAAMSAWQNQRGSIFTIDRVDADGKLTGTFINRAQGYLCQNIPYPVVGWIYGTAISFTTKWQSTTESCNSITAWTGFYNRDSGKIETLWDLSISGSTERSQILQGQDTFTPSPIMENKSLLDK